jgi:hypothetical protein
MTEIEGSTYRPASQIVVYDYAAHVSTVIEVTADAIYERSADPDIRRNALLWKLHAIPATGPPSTPTPVAFLKRWALSAQRPAISPPVRDRTSSASSSPWPDAARRLEQDATASPEPVGKAIPDREACTCGSMRTGRARSGNGPPLRPHHSRPEGGFAAGR